MTLYQCATLRRLFSSFGTNLSFHACYRLFPAADAVGSLSDEGPSRTALSRPLGRKSWTNYAWFTNVTLSFELKNYPSTCLFRRLQAVLFRSHVGSLNEKGGGKHTRITAIFEAVAQIVPLRKSRDLDSM